MFYNLHTIWQLILTVLSLLVFAGVSWRWPRRGAWLVIFLAPLYLLKIGNWPLTVLEALVWVFVGIWVIRKLKNKSLPLRVLPLRKGEKSLPSPAYSLYKREKLKRGLLWPVLLILLGVFLSTVFSVDWRVSAGILKSWFLAPIIFAFILEDIFEGDGFKEILSALFASAAVVAAISLIYLMLGRLTFDGRLAAFYLSPNHLAMWLVPGIIAGFGLWFDEKSHTPLAQRGAGGLVLFFNPLNPPLQGGRYWLFAIGYSLLAIALYFTYSYGAWLGLASAAVFILFYLWQLKLISRQQLLYVICFMLFAFIVIIPLQLNGGNNEKLINLITSPRSSWQSRLMVWRSAIEILKDHYLLGIGPGMFQQYYLAYQKFFPPYLEWAVPQPHNLFLAFWLQAGLLGFVGFLWLLVNFFRQSMFSVKHHLTSILFPDQVEDRLSTEGRRQEKSPLVIILMAIMIYFLVHGLVDTTFWKNDLALIFWVIVFSGYRAGRRAC